MVLDLLALGGVFLVRHVAAEISRQKRAKEAARRTPTPSAVSHSVPQPVPSSSASLPVDKVSSSSSSSSSSTSLPRDLVTNDASSSPFDFSSDSSSSTDSVAARFHFAYRCWPDPFVARRGGDRYGLQLGVRAAKLSAISRSYFGTIRLIVRCRG